MAFTTTEVNGWFQTIDGLPPTTASIPSALATQYVGELNGGTATPGVIQAELENFVAPPIPPPFTPTGLFFRTSVAQFVLREFQAAWDTVPSSGPNSQFDNWVARIIANPSLENGGGMSQTLAGTPQFMALYGTTSATQPASLAFVTQLAANLHVAVGPGAIANVGLPVWQVLQNFVTSPTVITSLQAPITNFQNLLLAGATPGGSIFDLPPPTQALTLTAGIDSPTQGFTSGNGATATTAGSVFNALPVAGLLGLNNTLNIGDNLQATDAAAGTTTLNYTAVFATDGVVGNPPLATNVTMNGISTLNITNAASVLGVGLTAGFSGSITGLTTVTLGAGSIAGVVLGTPGSGLNTALTTLNLDASQNFTAWMSVAALAGAADAVSINITGPYGTALAANHVRLVNTSGAGNGYETVQVAADSATFLQLGGAGGGVVDGTQSTKEVDLSGAGAIQLSAAVVGEYANVTTIDASGNTGGVTITGHTTGGMAGAAGFLDGNTVLTSFQGTGLDDLLDISSMTTGAQLAAFTKLDGGAGRDTLILHNTLLNSPTLLPDVNFEIIGSDAGLQGSVNWANLGNVVDTIQLFGSLAGALTLNNVPDGATLAAGAFSGAAGFPLTVNGNAAAVTGINDHFTLTASTLSGQDWGALTFNNFENVSIAATALGGVPPTENIASITMTPSIGGGSTLNFSGSGNFAVDGGLDTTAFLAAGPITAVFGSLLINDTASGVLGFGTTDAGSIQAATSGGVQMHGIDTSSSGVQEVGSATAHNSLVGSVLADIMTGGTGNSAALNGGTQGDIFLTEGGADTVNLVGGASHLEIYGGPGTQTSAGGITVYNSTASSVTSAGGAGSEVGAPGFWGNVGGNIFTTLHNTGTDATSVTANGFLSSSDVVDLSVQAWHIALPNLGLQSVIIGGGFGTPPIHSATGTAAVFTSQLLSGGSVVGSPPGADVIDFGGNFANTAQFASTLHLNPFGVTQFTGGSVAGLVWNEIGVYNDSNNNAHIVDIALTDSAATAAGTVVHTNDATVTLAVSSLVTLVGVNANSLAGHDIHFIT